MKSVDTKLATLKEAIELVAKDIIRAVALHQMFERANADDVVKAVSDTERAWGFGLVRDSLFLELVITLMRIHDSGRTDNASIESMMDIVADWRVRNHLTSEAVEAYKRRGVGVILGRDARMRLSPERRKREEDLRRRNKQRREEEAPREAEKIAQYLDEAFALYEKLQQDAARVSLKKLRNWEMAHRALGTKKHGAKYGDATRLLKLTVPLFEKLAVVVNGTDYGLSEDDELWSSYSDEFWRSVARPVRKRRSASST